MTDIPRPAPDFSLPADDGTRVALSALRGAPVVLFFYPRDMTSGCTSEAIAFSTLKPDFDKLGVKVFGLSKDSIVSHARFRAKHDLANPLLSDELDGASEAYGVWKEKKMYGKTFMGIERSTFLIDANGQIVAEWRKVKVDGHAAAVLAAARAF